MSKNIVLFSDGTGNSSAKNQKTNVWRLYDALDLHRPDQIAFYDDGVGSQEFLPLKVLGGVFGWGLKRNVRELYKYLCRNYEEGDRIYLFGFSRGAFTVRMLAGMICFCGLCEDDGTEADLDRKTKQNYNAFRSQFNSGFLTQGIRRFIGLDEPLEGARHPDIEFVGVWDTVDAYGLPIDELAIFWDKLIYPLYFPDQKLSTRVKNACHAISVDDERKTFHPVLWDESDEARLAAEGKVKPGRIEQVWFSGVHSDVGGGYSKPALAFVALDWMIAKVDADSRTDGSGLHLIGGRRQEVLDHSDWNGPQHDSRSGVAAYYRYKPRNIGSLCNDPRNKVLITKPKIHRGVMERIRSNTTPYAPTGIPASYEVVATRGTPPAFESEVQATERVRAMRAALKTVSRRSWLYFALLGTTMAFVAAPAYLTWTKGAGCVGAACLIDPLFQLAINLLPGVVAPWFEALRQSPIWLWGFVLAFLVLFWLKKARLSRTQEQAMSAWAELKNKRSVDLETRG